MNRYKTEKTDCKVSIKIIGKFAYFEITTDERLEVVQIPSNIVKKQFSDGAFIKHILNFFIKE